MSLAHTRLEGMDRDPGAAGPILPELINGLLQELDGLRGRPASSIGWDLRPLNGAIQERLLALAVAVTDAAPPGTDTAALTARAWAHLGAAARADETWQSLEAWLAREECRGTLERVVIHVGVVQARARAAAERCARIAGHVAQLRRAADRPS